MIVNQTLSLTAVFETQPVGTNLLLTNSSPSVGGTTSGGGSYPSEENAQISASPSPGYAFIGWSGEGVNDSYSASTTVLMSEDRNLTANFAIQSHSLILNASIGGSANGSGQFDYGSSPTISATPSAGYFFSGWDGEGVTDPNSASTTVLMSEDRNLTANFAIQSHSLTLNASTGGSANGSGQFDYGSSPTISATPSAGYFFSGWDGEGVTDPNSASTTVLMSEDRNLTANFAIQSHSLTLNASTGGSANGSGQFDYGSSPTISATPSTGYSFGGWSGEGTSDPSASSTTVLMNQDRMLTALFALNLHTLAINQQTGGSITASDGTYEYGTQVNIFAIPHQGYSFVRWTGEGVRNPTTLSTTVDMTEDRNVSVLFEINTHALNLHATEGGSVTGSGQFEYGSNPSISAIPNSGYSFLGWDGEGASDASSASTTALMSEDRNLTATFVLKRLSSIDETEDLGGGWFGAWFGYFLQTESGWCFHHELNWIYPFIHENGSIWFWSSNLGWLWTDLSVWGQSQCWSESLQSWLYFQPDHSQGPSFISYQSGELIPLQ